MTPNIRITPFSRYLFFKSLLTLYHKLSNAKRRFKTDMQAMFLYDVFNQGNFLYQGSECFTSFDENTGLSFQSGNHQNCSSSSISPRRSPRFMKSSTPRPIEKKNAPKRSLLPTLSEVILFHIGS